MQCIQTVEDLVQSMRDSLMVISAHAQLLLLRQTMWQDDADDLTAIRDAAERAATVLHTVSPAIVGKLASAAWGESSAFDLEDIAAAALADREARG